MSKLITGGLGFIGSHLARKLLNGGEDVILFDVIFRSPTMTLQGTPPHTNLC